MRAQGSSNAPNPEVTPMTKILLLSVAFLVTVTSSRVDAVQILYGATGSGGAASTLFTIDTSTGAATAVGPIGFSITGLAFDPTTGILYGGTSRGSAVAGLVTIDVNTGAGTFVGSYNAGNPDTRPPETMADITFDSTGNLFGFLEPDSDQLYRINIITGQATLVGDGPGSSVTGLAFDNSGTLFLETLGTLRILDAATGLLLTTVGDAGRFIGMGMDFDDTNELFALEQLGAGATGARNLVTVDTSTGAATTVGATAPGLDALAFGPAGVVAPDVVSEPSALLLLGMGVTGAAGYVARRRRSG
jgi:hypothetical protein